MKLLKITIAFIALVSLQIAAAQWLHVPPPVEARNLMVDGGGVPVAGVTTIIDETWVGCTNSAEPTSCTSGLTWTAGGANLFTITQTGCPGGYDQCIYQNSTGADLQYLATTVSITEDFTIEWYWKTNSTAETTYRASLSFTGANGQFARMGLYENSPLSLDYYNGSWNYFSPAVACATNTWYLFKIVYHFNGASADTWDFYVDGVLKQSGIAAWNSNSSITAIQFLHYSSDDTVDAWIGRVYVYK